MIELSCINCILMNPDFKGIFHLYMKVVVAQGGGQYTKNLVLPSDLSGCQNEQNQTEIQKDMQSKLLKVLFHSFNYTFIHFPGPHKYFLDILLISLFSRCFT